MRYSPAVVLSLWTFIRGEAWLSSPPRASWSPHRRRSFVLNDDTNNNNNHLFPRSNMMMRLDMGGYYAEPDDVDDDDDPTATSRQNTHVIFGVRCAERVVPLTSAFHVTLLQPVSDDDDTGAVVVPSSAEMALASYLWERRPRRPCGDDTRPAGGFDSTTRSVAIWGDASGLITLTLLRWNEDIVVFSCASDPESLRRIQMAHWMFTDATTTTRAGTLETGTLPVHCGCRRCCCSSCESVPREGKLFLNSLALLL